MEPLSLWIGIGLATLAVCLTLLPRRKPKARSQSEIRREWTQARPNWQGHEGWGGRE